MVTPGKGGGGESYISGGPGRCSSYVPIGDSRFDDNDIDVAQSVMGVSDPANVAAAADAIPQQDVDESEKALAKRVLRKIDWRLIPLMFITYNLNFMDKTILSSASVFGLREDTVSTPSQHTILALN